MTSHQIGGLIGLFVVFILPIIIGLILVFKAKTLIRWRQRFLAQYGGEQLEPSDRAVTIYRIVGWFFVIAPVVLFVVSLAIAMNHSQ